MSRALMLAMTSAMILGLLVGILCNWFLSTSQTADLASALSVATNIFLSLIKVIIAPLVLTTLTAGIARMESTAEIGRIGLKTIVWFIFASLVSLTLGLTLVDLIRPGADFTPTGQLAAHTSAVGAEGFSVSGFVAHLVPTSIVAAMANNEILQIVVFACLTGTAISAIKNRVPSLIAVIEQIAAVMLKVTNYVMLLAPVALFSALASTVATQGPSILLTYAKFVGGYYLGIAILWTVLLTVVAFLWSGGVGRIWTAVSGPIVIAFSTASSEAAYPKLLQGLEDAGLPRRLVSFVLPLGYSFNLDGSMMYLTFATIFIAQVYRINMPILQQVGVLLLMMVTSKGVAGVPRGSLVVLAATLPVFHLPDAGLLIVLAVDHLLDMGRSSTNVVGNAVACVVVERWETRSGRRRGPNSIIPT